MIARSIACTLGCSLLLMAGCAAVRAQDDGNGLPAPPRPAPAAGAPAGVVYDLTMWNGAPYIDLTVGGGHGRFLFDTGANTSGVDRTWTSGVASRPGPSTTLGGTTGNLSLPTVVFDRLDLGSSHFQDPVMTVQDFSNFGLAEGRAQAGLLGTDFLNRYAVTLDLAARKATLALRGERATPGQDDRWIDLQYPLRLPTINIQVAGVTVPCRVDSGAAYLDDRPYLDVNRAMVDALEKAGIKLRQTGSITVSGVAGPVSLPVLEGDASAGSVGLTVGPVDVSGVVLVVHDFGTLATGSPLALAGAPILSRLGRITLDPFDGKLWFVRSPAPPSTPATPARSAAREASDARGTRPADGNFVHVLDERLGEADDRDR